MIYCHHHVHNFQLYNYVQWSYVKIRYNTQEFLHVMLYFIQTITNLFRKYICAYYVALSITRVFNCSSSSQSLLNHACGGHIFIAHGGTLTRIRKPDAVFDLHWNYLEYYIIEYDTLRFPEIGYHQNRISYEVSMYS